MNKKVVILIASLFGVLLLVLTNPKEEAHKAAVKAKVNSSMQKALNENAPSSSDSFGRLGANLGAVFGDFVINKLVDAGVTRKNYLLFSTTVFNYGSQSKTIGFGILGTVFVSSKIDQTLNSKELMNGN